MLNGMSASIENVGGYCCVNVLLVDLADHPVNGVLGGIAISVNQCVGISVQILCGQPLFLTCNSHFGMARVETNESAWTLAHSDRFLFIVGNKVGLDVIQVLLVPSPCSMSIV